MAAGRETLVATAARAAGFPLVGCAPIAPLPVDGFVRDWLAQGRAGEMHYLERGAERRLDPNQQFPWARSLVCVGFPYRPPPPPAADWRASLRGRIAAYAVGPDYHRHVRARLDRLAEVLGRLFPGSRHLSYVDTGAILEREWALRAGIGWIAKNTLVLHRQRRLVLLPRRAGDRPRARCRAAPDATTAARAPAASPPVRPGRSSRATRWSRVAASRI